MPPVCRAAAGGIFLQGGKGLRAAVRTAKNAGRKGGAHTAHQLVQGRKSPGIHQRRHPAGGAGKGTAFSRPGGGGQRAAAASHGGGLYHQGAQAHQRTAVCAGSDLWRAHRDGGEYFLLHGRDAGVLCDLLAGRAGSEVKLGRDSRPGSLSNRRRNSSA